MTIETTSTAATSASRLSHFGSTATSASQTPSTTEASTAATVPQVTAESSAARPVLRRYAAAIATIRNISIPSRSVTRRTWPMPLGGEHHLAKQRLAGHFRGRRRRQGRRLDHDQTIIVLTIFVNRSHDLFRIKEQ